MVSRVSLSDSVRHHCEKLIWDMKVSNNYTEMGSGFSKPKLLAIFNSVRLLGMVEAITICFINLTTFRHFTTLAKHTCY